jgi:GNAT superfamily N-acetyltransferase
MTDANVRDVFALVDSQRWGWELHEIQRIHKLDPDSSVVATVEGSLVGLVTAIDYGTFAFVVHVITAEGWRGKGVGKMMMDAVLDHLDLRGVKNVELHANPEAAEF